LDGDRDAKIGRSPEEINQTEGEDHPPPMLALRFCHGACRKTIGRSEERERCRKPAFNGGVAGNQWVGYPRNACFSHWTSDNAVAPSCLLALDREGVSVLHQSIVRMRFTVWGLRRAFFQAIIDLQVHLF